MGTAGRCGYCNNSNKIIKIKKILIIIKSQILKKSLYNTSAVNVHAVQVDVHVHVPPAKTGLIKKKQLILQYYYM